MSIKLLKELFFPQFCIGCGKFGVYFCSNCQNKMQFDLEKICPMCELMAIEGKTHPTCKTRYSMDGITSFFVYDGVVKKALHRLKYKPYLSDITQALVQLGLQPENLFGKFNTFVVTAVPLHPSRKRMRGFNQSEELGKAIAKQLQLSFSNKLIKRIINTKPQVTLDAKQRRKNIEHAFQADTAICKNIPSIIIVDDVWTTGSTLRSCTNVLKRAGVEKVWGLTIAR